MPISLVHYFVEYVSEPGRGDHGSKEHKLLYTSEQSMRGQRRTLDDFDAISPRGKRPSVRAITQQWHTLPAELAGRALQLVFPTPPVPYAILDRSTT